MRFYHWGCKYTYKHIPSPYPGDVGHHNHPFLGPSVLAGSLMRLAHSWHPSHRASTSDLHGLVYAPPISGWTMALIPFVTSYLNNTQYCPLLAPRNQTSQEVTHPGTTLAKAYLTAKIWWDHDHHGFKTRYHWECKYTYKHIPSPYLGDVGRHNSKRGCKTKIKRISMLFRPKKTDHVGLNVQQVTPPTIYIKDFTIEKKFQTLTLLVRFLSHRI